MQLSIRHTIHYTYSAAVQLLPHHLYVWPRLMSGQRVVQHLLSFSETPSQLVQNLDAEGNRQTVAFFMTHCRELHIQAILTVETNSINPFDFLYFPFEAQQLPLQYTAFERSALRLYLAKQPEAVRAIAQTSLERVNYATSPFLMHLCLAIASFRYENRSEGEAHTPLYTWQRQAGTCRDFAVLFIALCQAAGLAARFVSGYCYGIDRHAHDLHAWAEVYLPGGGWRGFDPTEGRATNEQYVTLAASAIPQQIAPVSGYFQSPDSVISCLSTHLEIVQI